MNNTGTITTTEHCMHGRHMVEKDKITWLELPGGGRRRICEDCKAIVLEIRKNNKGAKA